MSAVSWNRKIIERITNWMCLEYEVNTWLFKRNHKRRKEVNIREVVSWENWKKIRFQQKRKDFGCKKLILEDRRFRKQVLS